MLALVFIALIGCVAGTPTEQECTDYCTDISATCMGDLAQFPPAGSDQFDICMSACSTYPTGAPNTPQTEGDWFECRSYHLGVAMTSPQNATIHCVHAGFSGGMVCGTFCEAYCDNIQSACSGTDAVFDDRTSCLQLCAQYPSDMMFNESSNAVAGGNSIQCRSWHSQVATTTQPSTHCKHASPQGGGACGAGCDNYCDTLWNTCTGSLQQYETKTICMDACMAFPMPTDYTSPADPTTTGNNVPCRVYHAQVANQSSTNANTHCIHAGPTGGNSANLCGTECEAYCSLLVAACGDVSGDCMTRCATLNATASTITAKQIYEGDASVLGTEPNVACGISQGLLALEDDAHCEMAMAGKCSSAALLKASWGLIAVIFLALGFSF